MSEVSQNTDAPEITMAKKLRGKKKEALWLLSFADMTLILMSFFALMLSFSSFSTNKFENVKEGMQDKSRPLKQDNLRTISEKVQKAIEKNDLKNTVQVTFTANGTAIEFKDALLFSSGSADSNKKFAKVVDSVMSVIAKAPPKYKLVFEGHTDDVPYRGKEFKSNWELSAARGFSMLREFESRGVDQRRMSVLAFAHTKPKVPIEGKKDKTLEDARGANRRVVIRIE